MSDPLPDHPAALPKGRSIAEYEIVRVLGAGGFGITYLAFDHQLDGPVAIKEYFPTELATRVDGDQVAATAPTNQETFAWGLERFLDEARAIHRLRHSNVVQARRYLEANGTAYLVMEYVEGESLKAILDRRGSLSAEEWRPWMDALLDGLDHVHSHGYLHRDIKPANIVIRSEDGEPVLIDFGSARLQHRDRTHTQVLTAAYAPIEQHSTGVTQGPPTDIYALAATSYRALTGTRLSSAPDRILNDDYEPLADRLEGTERRWLAAIDHGLAVRPESRPQTVEEWHAELGTAGGEAPAESSTGLFEATEPSIGPEANPPTIPWDTPPPLPDAVLLDALNRLAPWQLVGARRWPAVGAWGALLLFAAVLSLVLLTNGPARDSAAPPPTQPGGEENDADAQFLLGERHYYGDGTDRDYGAAVRWYLRAADQGHAQAQFQIAFMYDHGQGVPEDMGEAAVWYRKAAEQGHAVAQHNLGWIYRWGRGVPEDEAESAAWYRRAANQGHAAAERKRAAQGDAQAQFRLAYMYSYGQGVPRDNEEAVAWYRKAADQGHVLAQFYLGLSFAGRWTPENDREAVAWYRKAADQGYAEAQFFLGQMYYHGQGVPQDYREAVAWYRKAADQGRHARAQFRLGSMYYGGRGVPQDLVLAYAWLNIAAAQGDKHAEGYRDRIAKHMTRGQIFEALMLCLDRDMLRHRESGF